MLARSETVMRPTVLVRDVHAETTRLIGDLLGEEGFDVLVAACEAEYRSVIAQRGIDMLIVDSHLPDGNGMTLVREIRRESDIAIIVVSARRTETDQVVALEVGADDYITKPFRPREFRARVGAVYRRRRGACYPAVNALPPEVETARDDCDTVSFDRYRLIPARREVLSPYGEIIDLTASEFDLLLALVERRGEVVGRDRLMRVIRGAASEPDDRAVDGLISHLRRKIPAPRGRGHYIRTVYGRGYRFCG